MIRLILAIALTAAAALAQLGGSAGVGSGSATAPATCSVSGVSSIACTHSLGTSQPWVTCYDGSGNMLGSATASTSITGVVATTANVATITFSGNTTGTCVISTGSMGPTGSTGPAGTVSSASSVTMQQTATPANPSAGYSKIYVKSDGKLYTLDSSGSEVQIGSGSAVSAYGYGSSHTALATSCSPLCTAVSFNQNRWDTSSIHSTSVNPTRFTAPVTGYYTFLCQVSVNNDATGAGVQISVNGVQEAFNTTFNGTYSIWQASLVGFSAAAGDYFECRAYSREGRTPQTGTGSTFAILKRDF